MDQEQRLTQATAGNGVGTTRAYDQNRGFVTAIAAGASNAVADFSYSFDTLGNLTQRTDANQSLTENFTYDVLNRLSTYQIVGETAKTMTYDDLGNITSKSDVGSYTYAASRYPRPHAVVAAGSDSYAYDANGAMTSGAGRAIAWTAFGKVASMTQGATSVSFVYGPERQRVKQTGAAGDTFYYDDAASGAYFEKLVGSTVTQWSDYLFAGGEMVGVKFTRSDTTELTRWFVTDHLGSVSVLTDETGAVTERPSYDAWGKRRYPDGTDDTAGTLTSETTRGFTSHEMIDDVDLVNMNGRVYDPNIGRFMSADPFIHDVTNSQDLNRYSYVHNNPLSYTDMNGYGFFKKLGSFFKKIWKPLLAIVAAVTIIHFGPLLIAGLPAGTPLVGGGLTFLEGAVISGVAGGVGNVILTGRPRAFLTGFGQGVATFGVGHGLFKGGAAFGSAKWAGKAVAHGVVGGAFAEIRGGSFSSGFLAAGFSSAVAPLGPKGSIWEGAAFHAAVGGTGSVLGGGKFADGAVTGAFTYLFNDALNTEGGLRCNEGDQQSCSLLRSALKDEYSIARQVNQEARAQDLTITVTYQESWNNSNFVGGSSSSAYLNIGGNNGFVPVQPGTTPRLFELREVFEHELSHALDWVQGVPYDSGSAIIDVSGQRVRYAPGHAATEARAINRTNLYRSNVGLSYRYSYEDPNFPNGVD